MLELRGESQVVALEGRQRQRGHGLGSHPAEQVGHVEIRFNAEEQQRGLVAEMHREGDVVAAAAVVHLGGRRHLEPGFENLQIQKRNHDGGDHHEKRDPADGRDVIVGIAD